MFDSSQTVIYQLKVVLGISPSDLASPHGNVFKALELIKKLLDNTSILAEHEKKPCLEAKKLSKILEKFRTYISNNGAYIPNYGER